MSKPAISSPIVAVLAAVVALGSARLAAAQQKPTVVIWQAPPGCPTAAQVQTEVENNLARAGAASAPVVAMVSVSGPTDGRWQASLLFQVGFTRAERKFEAESCQAIASAAALVIALWAEGRPDVPAPVASARDAESPPPRPAVAASPPRFVLMLNGLLDWGTMPDPPGGGMEAAAGPIWTFPKWRVRALGGVSFFPNRRTPVMDTRVEQANFELFDFSARGCATVVIDRFEIGPCAGAELAMMRGSGTIFQNDTQLWFSLLGAAMASWSISPAVDVFGRAEVVVPTTTTSFLVPGGGVVYQVPSVAVRGALGLELRF